MNVHDNVKFVVDYLDHLSVLLSKGSFFDYYSS